MQVNSSSFALKGAVEVSGGARKRAQKIFFFASGNPKRNLFRNPASDLLTSRGFPDVSSFHKGIPFLMRILYGISSLYPPLDFLPQMPLERACRKAGPFAHPKSAQVATR
jgi:hypothetical protein